MTAVGLLLRTTRRQQHATLDRVAAALGISVPYLSELERGVKGPSYPTVRRIAAHLEVSDDELKAAAMTDAIRVFEQEWASA